MPDFLRFIVFILAFQGIITSLILFANRNIRASHNKYLVLFVFIFSTYLLGQNLFWGNFYPENPHFLFSTIAFPLLFGPLLYFYMTPTRKHRYGYLHFLPFLLLVVKHIPFYLFGAQEKIDFFYEIILTLEVNAKFYIYRIAFVVQMAAYFFVLRKAIRSSSFRKSFKWYQTLNTFYGSLAVGYILQMTVYAIYNKVQLITVYFALFYTLMAVFILYFVTRTLLVPELFRTVVKVPRNRLNTEKKELYSKKILTVMETDHMFLKKDLRLVDLAHRVDTTEHQLSQVLREHFGVNFFEFINSYRIDTAKRLLLDSEFKHFTIDAIAQEVGFKSKSSFYDAFKKFVGVTPLAYKKKHLELADGEE